MGKFEFPARQAVLQNGVRSLSLSPSSTSQRIIIQSLRSSHKHVKSCLPAARDGGGTSADLEQSSAVVVLQLLFSLLYENDEDELRLMMIMMMLLLLAVSEQPGHRRYLAPGVHVIDDLLL